MGELRAHDRPGIVAAMAQEPLDLLIVGGGITGAGLALEAASRGLRTGLIERRDFASGTSSRSSKMVHGGLRYLATGDIALVREALHERAHLQVNAAHLVHPLPMVLPLYKENSWVWRPKLGAGLLAYDLLGAWKAGGRHRWLRPQAAVERIPNLRPSGLKGAYAYADAQADDVRLVMAVLRSAVAAGALVTNGVAATGLLRDGDTVQGVAISADFTTPVREIEARVVINATGVWSDKLAQHSGGPAIDVMPSKGVHLTVPRSSAGIESCLGMFAYTGRNVFIEPWDEDLAIVGTTDAPFDGDLTDPRATESDITELLTTVNAVLATPIDRRDVLSAWAGLRPLVVDRNAQASRTSDVSRKHKLFQSPGLMTLVGGKLTTFRAMAEEAVDAVCKQLGTHRPSTTRHLQLIGADLPMSSDAIRELQAAGCDERLARHLLRRYGSEARHIMHMCATDPDLRDPIHTDRPYIAAEVAFAAQYEMAACVDDVLWRRTRLSLEVADTAPVVTTVNSILESA